MSEQFGGQPPKPPQWGTPQSAPGVPPTSATPPPPGVAPHQVTKPGIIPLRPLTTVEVLEGGFQAMRANPKLMCGVGLLVYTVMMVLIAAMTAGYFLWMFSSAGLADFSGDFDSAAVVQLVVLSVGYMLLTTAITIFGQAILTTMLSHAVGQAVLGSKPTWRWLWQQSKSRLWPVIMCQVVISLIVSVPVLLCVGLIIGSVAMDIMPLTVLFGIASVPVAIVVWALWFTVSQVAVPIIVLESAPTLSGLARAWQLTKRSFWRLFLILLLTWVLIGVVSSTLVTPFQVVGQVMAMFFFDGAAEPDPTADGMMTASEVGMFAVSMILPMVGSILAGALTEPYRAAAATLLYVDDQMRHEGMDVKLMDRAAQRTANTPSSWS